MGKNILQSDLHVNSFKVPLSHSWQLFEFHLCVCVFALQKVSTWNLTVLFNKYFRTHSHFSKTLMSQLSEETYLGCGIPPYRRTPEILWVQFQTTIKQEYHNKVKYTIFFGFPSIYKNYVHTILYTTLQSIKCATALTLKKCTYLNFEILYC